MLQKMIRMVTMSSRESLNRKLNQGGTDGTRLSAR